MRHRPAFGHNGIRVFDSAISRIRMQLYRTRFSIRPSAAPGCGSTGLGCSQ
ncbi:MAG: hypothetical protein IKR25_05690 [Muribaculaceae bacterium]|nr:hypothetical protein [Muribaculaceae bacterium]